MPALAGVLWMLQLQNVSLWLQLADLSAILSVALLLLLLLVSSAEMELEIWLFTHSLAGITLFSDECFVVSSQVLREGTKGQTTDVVVGGCILSFSGLTSDGWLDYRLITHKHIGNHFARVCFVVSEYYCLSDCASEVHQLSFHAWARQAHSSTFGPSHHAPSAYHSNVTSPSSYQILSTKTSPHLLTTKEASSSKRRRNHSEHPLSQWKRKSIIRMYPCRVNGAPTSHVIIYVTNFFSSTEHPSSNPQPITRSIDVRCGIPSIRRFLFVVTSFATGS